MGYDIYAIRESDFEKYGFNVLSVPDLFDNSWYFLADKPYSHGIFKCWRSGYFDDRRERCMPYKLQYFYWNITTSSDAKRIIEELKPYMYDISINEFVLWLEYWSDKGACFYLST